MQVFFKLGRSLTLSVFLLSLHCNLIDRLICLEQMDREFVPIVGFEPHKWWCFDATVDAMNEFEI